MSYADRGQQREYVRRWIANRRAAWLAENGPCVQCGSSERLQVDHIDPSAKVDHRIWSWAESRRKAELAKCQVLCAECHLRKTRSENTTRGHGTSACYNRGCRCQSCRDAHAAKNRGQKQRRLERERRLERAS